MRHRAVVERDEHRVRARVERGHLLDGVAPVEHHVRDAEVPRQPPALVQHRAGSDDVEHDPGVVHEGRSLDDGVDRLRLSDVSGEGEVDLREIEALRPLRPVGQKGVVCVLGKVDGVRDFQAELAPEVLVEQRRRDRDAVRLGVDPLRNAPHPFEGERPFAESARHEARRPQVEAVEQHPHPVLPGVDEPGIDLHHRRELVAKDDVVAALQPMRPAVRVPPERQVIPHPVQGARAARMERHPDHADAVALLLHPLLDPVLGGDLVSRHARVRKPREHRDLMPPGDEPLAHVGGIEGLGPVVLARDEDPHRAPSPVLTVRSVRQMMLQSSAAERFSMYSMSSLAFSLGSSS